MLLSDVQQCDFVVVAPCRYIAWPVAEMQPVMEKDPDLRAQIRDITSEDLAAKIRAMIHPGAT